MNKALGVGHFHTNHDALRDTSAKGSWYVLWSACSACYSVRTAHIIAAVVAHISALHMPTKYLHPRCKRYRYAGTEP